MSKDFEFCDSMSTASTADDGCITPTHTNITEGGYDTLVTEAVPGPDEIFIIRHRQSGMAITLADGQLQLCEGLNPPGGFHWRCVEKEGWLGFRNCVSGTYIGHDERKRFVARVSHHKPHEYFCVRPHPKKGGYELLMRHGNELWRMDVSKDGKALVESKQEGATWDFFKSNLSLV
ncbi:hypothetical protein B0J13DRAFT_57589 [Dactylonectria estremocensis]|uniref:Uncharacterized protein n=1 Tax=Dactylonectria estremocensis TaxID=1079267 RepID=A0A9P9EQ61_9HYPO|nr:hypothetical protein B0J13DRAFT_57589 [Dactylonectria estremocensis]